MFGFESRAHALRAGTGIMLLCVAACGGAKDTPFYGTPMPPEGAASTGALVSGGASSGTGGTVSGVAGMHATGGGIGVSGGANEATAGEASASGGTGASRATAGTGAGGDASSTGGSGDTSATGGEGGRSEPSGGSAATSSEAGAGGEAPTPVDCSPHDASAVPFDGHCYAWRADIKTFDDAVSDCQALGAHLVTISSANRTVAQFLAENTFVWQLAGSTESWIGATDGKSPHQPGDGTFYTWLTGEPMTLDNWSSGEPNNARSSCQDGIPCSCDHGACYEHCGFLWDTPGKQMNALPGWNDRVCDHQLPYVCEWDG
ncbi:MAG TPA: lectin-like protein [Polyangiaceae bacterium]|nr:lectin-like protein [Polyangiaceae bacterium]